MNVYVFVYRECTLNTSPPVVGLTTVKEVALRKLENRRYVPPRCLRYYVCT